MIGELGAAFSKTFGRGERLRCVMPGNKSAGGLGFTNSGKFHLIPPSTHVS